MPAVKQNGVEQTGASLQADDRHPYAISFSGMDGAGKTTQIDALLLYLREAGIRVRVLRFWDDIAVAGVARETLSHKLFKSEKGIGSPDQPVRRRDKNVSGWYMTLARMLLYTLDAARLSLVVKTLSSTEADVVIFDRYIYDQLVNLNLRNPITRAYSKLMLKLVPRPDIAFVLDADPVQARARKPEYPIKFLRRIREAYQELAAWGGLTSIVPLTREDVTRSILRSLPPFPQLTSSGGIPPLAFRSSHQ